MPTAVVTGAASGLGLALAAASPGYAATWTGERRR